MKNIKKRIVCACGIIVAIFLVTHSILGKDSSLKSGAVEIVEKSNSTIENLINDY